MRTLPTRLGVGILSIAVALAVAPVRGQDAASARAAGTRNAITGKVVDGTGKPVPGVVVTLVQRDTSHGVVRFHPANVSIKTLTDDAGAYRLENLDLGEYFVVAIPQNNSLMRNGSVTRAGHAITYHPSARRAADATAVMVNVREAQRADITLAPAALALVSGTVFGSDGQPVHSGSMGISHGDNLFGLDSKGMRIRPDGSFQLPGLAPGTYFLQFREGPWPRPRDVTPLVSGAKVVIDGKDVAGVRVVPIHMVRGTGRVMVDAAARSLLQPSGIHISAFPVVTDGNPGPQRGGTVKDDLAFEFATWPGRAYIRVTMDTPGWKVTAIHYKGADVTDTGIDFKEGQEISGIEIQLARMA